MYDNSTIHKNRILIENNLNKVLFSELKIGEILSYELIVYFDFMQRKPSTSFLTQIKNWLYGLCLFHCWRKPKNYDFSNKIIWVTSSFHRKMIDFYTPFSKLSLKSGHRFYLFHNKKTNKREGYFFNFRLGLKGFFIWKKEYRKTKYKFSQILNELEKKELLNESQKYILKSIFKIKSQKVIQLQQLFKQNFPCAIITDFDRQQFNSSVIAIGNQYNIPTFTLIHGSTVPVNNFVPFIAKNCLCWGKGQLEQFKPYMKPNQSIYIVGNPKFNNEISFNRKNVIKKIGIDNSSNIVTFATNGFTTNLYLSFLFCEAVKDSNWFPIIKIHQRENKSEYDKLKKTYPQLLIIQDSLKLEEVFALTDFLLVQNSTVALEGIIKGIPMSVFNPTNDDPGICTYILENSDTINFTSKNILHDFLNKSNRSNIREFINLNSQKEFISLYCQYFGAESVKRIIHCIENSICK